MNIEKTYKLTIKDTAFNLTEEEVSALYETCRRALNISITGTKPFDNPIAPTYPTWPNTYPSWPTYPAAGNPDHPLWRITYVTSKGTGASDVMDSTTTTSEGIKVG